MLPATDDNTVGRSRRKITILHYDPVGVDLDVGTTSRDMGTACVIAVQDDVVVRVARNRERLCTGVITRIDMDRLAGGHCRQCIIERSIVGDGNGTAGMRRCGRYGGNRSG